MTLALRQRPLPQVVRQIVQRDNGAWFDPSDMSTLYQDAAGMIPVTAVEQLVGKMLDKSGNGYHATQSITASRPTLSARYNLLTKTEDFSDSAWNNYGYTAGCTVIPNAAMSPANTQTADKIIASTTPGPHNIGQLCASAIGKNFYYVNVKAAEIKQVALLVRPNLDVRYDRVIYDLEYGTVVGTGGSLIPEIVNLGDGWYRVGVYINYSSTSTRVGVALINPSASDSTYGGAYYTGDGVSGLYLWGASLNIGQSAYQYQRVNTSTDYDTDERYFPKYLRLDGVDDYLTLGDVFDIGIEGVSISASVILFDATKSPIAGKSRTAAEGGRYFLGVEPSSFLFASHHSAPPANIGLAAPIAVNTVFTAKLGPHGARYLSLYKNAALINSVGTPLTASSYDTNNPFWIGAYPDSSVTTPAYGYLNGGIYGLIITKSALTDAQRVICERYLGRKAGVQL